MSRRAVLWVAFVLVHVVVATLGFLMPNEPMGDVYRVYEPWSSSALHGGGIVGITEPWVYPQLALVPMLLAQALRWIGDSYIIGWAVLVTMIDALAFAVLVGRGRSAGRRAAAWFWLAFVLALGPVGIYRLDAVTAALAVAGCLWLVGRPWLGSILLAAATWMKVWPAALLAAAVIAVRRRFTVVGGAVAVSVLTLAVVYAAGGAAYAWGFIGSQTGRGLQLEAPVSAFYLWRAVIGIPDSYIYYNHEIITFEVTGPGVDAVIWSMTPVLAIVVGAVVVTGAIKAARGASFLALFPVLSLALVTGFIAFNKVGSPQYLTWIVAPLVMGLVLDRRRWWGPAVLGLVMAVLTQAVYPLMYDQLLLAAPVPAALLTIRNGLMVAMFFWSAVRLVRVPAHRHTRTPIAATETVLPAGQSE